MQKNQMALFRSRSYYETYSKAQVTEKKCYSTTCPRFLSLYPMKFFFSRAVIRTRWYRIKSSRFEKGVQPEGARRQRNTKTGIGRTRKGKGVFLFLLLLRSGIVGNSKRRQLWWKGAAPRRGRNLDTWRIRENWL